MLIALPDYILTGVVILCSLIMTVSMVLIISWCISSKLQNKINTKMSDHNFLLITFLSAFVFGVIGLFFAFGGTPQKEISQNEYKVILQNKYVQDKAKLLLSQNSKIKRHEFNVLMKESEDKEKADRIIFQSK